MDTIHIQIPYNEIASQTLVLHVFDFDRFGKHDAVYYIACILVIGILDTPLQIGQVSVPLGRIDLASTIEKTVPIEAPPVGDELLLPG